LCCLSSRGLCCLASVWFTSLLLACSAGDPRAQLSEAPPPGAADAAEVSTPLDPGRTPEPALAEAPRPVEELRPEWLSPTPQGHWLHGVWAGPGEVWARTAHQN
jgi:hypothetical protein